ncbi:MAG: hypothetical protein KBD16_00485 [Candidatus Pacebacteria bacterium]|nr:hypothetical protein [Candidatus Paceibacterota bacterium]
MKMFLVALLLAPTVTFASASSALPEPVAVFQCKPPSDNCAEQFKEGDVIADIKGGSKLVLRTVTPSSEEGKPTAKIELLAPDGVVLQTEELPANIGHVGRFLLEDKWYLKVQNITMPGSKKGLVMLLLRVELRP